MIQSVIDSIKPGILALPWVERFGGLTTMLKNTMIPDGQSGYEISYPISCNVDGAKCFETAKYKDLMPHSDVKSMIYFEQVGDLKPTGAHTYGQPQMIFSMDLISWVNYKSLGETSCTATPAMIGELVRLINSSKYISSYSVHSKQDVIDRIFAKYKYNQPSALFLHPYDAFAIRFTGTFYLDCDTTYVPSNPLTCIDLS